MAEGTAALIAGGRSRRMGTDKAFLDWGGRPLWRHQLEKLRGLSPEPMLLSCRPDQPFPDEERVVRVFDAEMDCGPLGGIAACLRECRAPRLVVLGIDLPHLPAGLLERLLAESSDNCGTVICQATDGRELYEPLATVYPVAMRDLAEEHLAAERYSLQALIRRGVEAGLMLVSREVIESQWFLNVNTPEDLADAAASRPG